MKVNSHHLTSLSKGPASSFDREGRLRVGRETQEGQGRPQGMCERWCRLRGNLLFIMKKPQQISALEEVLVLERCQVLESTDNNNGLLIRFDSGEPGVYVECVNSGEVNSWLVALREANSEGLTNRIRHLRTQLMDTAGNSAVNSVGNAETTVADAVCPAKQSPLEFSIDCRGLSIGHKEKRPHAVVQVSVINTQTHTITDYCCTEIVESTSDPVFLTGVCISPDHPFTLDTTLKLTVYHAKVKTHDTRSFLGFSCFSIRDLLRTNEPQLSLSLRSADGTSEVGKVKLGRLQMRDMENREGEDTTSDIHGHKCPLLCDSLHGSMHDRDNSPMMRAVFRSTVCKVYRFQTEASRWMLVREQMSESPLSSSLPKQLLSCYIQEDMRRVQELCDLCDLSPYWDRLRTDVIAHYSQLISTYQETLTELNKLTGSSCSFKASCSKSDRYLEFIPVNLHTQRMQVTCSRRTVWYDVVTVGAPADHYQGFKHGGLQRLLNKPDSDNKSVSAAYCCISYSPEESSRAREVLSSVSQLQPLISGLTEEILQAALEVNSQRLQNILHSLAHRTDQFVHTLKDELVKNALLALHTARPAYHLSNGHAHVTHGNGTGPRLSSANQDGLRLSIRRQESIPQHTAYDEEEEWDRVLANVAMSLNCIIAMVDRLQEREHRKQEVTSQTQNDVTTTSQNTDPSCSPWQASLAPLPDSSRAPWQASLAPLPDSSRSPWQASLAPLPDSSRAPWQASLAPLPDPFPSWQEQLLPLVVTLKECVSDAVERARCAMTFVLLQGAAASACHGQALTHRRDAVFSQALCAVVCGFVLRLYSGLEDKVFLLQLCEVGLITQFEGLLSTYSDEVGMLEDMEMGVSDLNRVSFKITEAKSEQPTDLLPSVTGLRGCFCVEVPLPSETYLLLPGELRDGRDLRVHPLLFNIGINQQQSLAERFGDSSLQERINLRSCEMLKSYYKTLRDKLPNLTLPWSRSPLAVEDLLCSLEQSLEMKKRKNVEVLWLAASVCRRLNGVRLTSCKSAKDRTSMSVTLEQCMLLRDEHTLSKEHFNRALDCMRREGCRMENVEKNIRSRKYAFNSIQLKTFPKPYRPPEGTYGKVDT
ncbi:type II inositol 3,4-bisphosphate 4-phosphatase-like isoform X2 [Oncorhynchus mykiss]|nr:type II inositol 3,4-bisphosphate 4-phosphatase-like isoform X2 [Oncorhynchus mykiss]